MELKNFKIEVTKIFLTKHYAINDTEWVPTIQNGQGGKGLHLIRTLTGAEQEVCETVKGLFDMHSENFKLQHYETVLSLQHCKFLIHTDESVGRMDG